MLLKRLKYWELSLLRSACVKVMSSFGYDDLRHESTSMFGFGQPRCGMQGQVFVQPGVYDAAGSQSTQLQLTTCVICTYQLREAFLCSTTASEFEADVTPCAAAAASFF